MKYLTFVIALLVASAGSANAQTWTPPSVVPPSQPGIFEPVNTGTTAQVKNGGLSVNAFSAFLNSYFAGNVGIGVISPTNKLEVSGNAQVSGSVIAGAGSAASPSHTFSSDLDTGLYAGNNQINFTANGTRVGLIAWAGAVGRGQWLAGDSQYGLAAGPTYSFLQDAGSGVYNPAAGTLAFATGNTERVRITSAGSVGIGIPAPSQALDVNGYVRGSTGLCIGADCRTSWPAAGGSGTVTSITAGTGLTGGTITTSGTIAADTAYLQRRVSGTCASGNAIQTIAADGTVTCQSTSSATPNLQTVTTAGNTTSLGISAASLLTTGGAAFLGNVGAGLSSPSYRLDVAGAGSGNVGVRLTPDYSKVRLNGIDLLGYPTQDLWTISNSSSVGSVLGTSWDWDSQVALRYAPGTFGAGGGIFTIGQTDKNNANYTHGVTRFMTNGLERMRIDPAGNVGIGTTGPNEPLTVMKDGVNEVSSTFRGVANFRDTAGSKGLYIGYDSAEQMASLLPQGANSGISFWSHNGTWGERMRIGTNGNVGVGTTNPGAKLEVAGQVKITGGAPGAGKVLTSDATGLASWTTPSSGLGGSGTTNYVPKWTAGTTLGNSLIYDSGTAVGVGTAAPTGLLSVGSSNQWYISNTNLNTLNTAGSINGVADGWINYRGYADGFSQARNFNIGDGRGANIAWFDGTNRRMSVNNGQAAAYTLDVNGTVNAGSGITAASLLTTGSASITGNLGVGTASPGAKVQVSSGDASYALFGPNSTWGGTLIVGAGTSAISSGRAQAISTNGNLHLDAGTGQNIYLANYNGTNTFINPGAGNVGIGTTNPGIYKLNVNGSVGAVSFFYTSDKSLKRDIAPLEGSLEKILRLDGVSFAWKKDGEKSVGLIAQDVEKVYPELVRTSTDGIKSVEYGNLVAPLIEAVKEQQRQIEALKAEVEALKASR